MCPVRCVTYVFCGSLGIARLSLHPSEIAALHRFPAAEGHRSQRRLNSDPLSVGCCRLQLNPPGLLIMGERQGDYLQSLSVGRRVGSPHAISAILRSALPRPCGADSPSVDVGSSPSDSIPISGLILHERSCSSNEGFAGFIARRTGMARAPGPEREENSLGLTP
jgi:hypothetical protein